MDFMSDDAQAARAKKARQNLANHRASGANIRSDLADALQPADQEPVGKAHITNTPVTPIDDLHRLLAAADARVAAQDAEIRRLRVALQQLAPGPSLLLATPPHAASPATGKPSSQSFD